MSQLSDAVDHMVKEQGMTELYVWFNVTQDGRRIWLCSCKITSFSCFVGEGTDAIDAMLDAMGQAWEANRKQQ